MMGQNSHPPPQIALPAQGTVFNIVDLTDWVNKNFLQGMVEFRDALTGVIDEYGQDEGESAPLPSSTVIGDRRSKQVCFVMCLKYRSCRIETHRLYNRPNSLRMVSFKKVSLKQINVFFGQSSIHCKMPWIYCGNACAHHIHCHRISKLDVICKNYNVSYEQDGPHWVCWVH